MVETVTEALKTHKTYNKVKEVFTFNDPSAIGVIQFNTKQDVATFLRKMSKTEIKMSDDKRMSFTTNETFEQRTTEKPLGYIKFHLNAKLNIPLKQIRVNRKKQTVEVQGRLVAKSGGQEGDFNLVFMGQATEVKQEVKVSMDAWLAKVNGSE